MTAASNGAFLDRPQKWRAYSAFGLLHGCMVPRETAALSAHVLCIPYNHTLVYSVTFFKATYVRCMTVRLAVTCHLYFWQNDRDLVRATAVTRVGVGGWGGGTDTEIKVSTES